MEEREPRREAAQCADFEQDITGYAERWLDGFDGRHPFPRKRSPCAGMDRRLSALGLAFAIGVVVGLVIAILGLPEGAQVAGKI